MFIIKAFGEGENVKIYNILLNSSLGKKTGQLCARIKNGELSGYLSLLGHTEPIKGTVDESGHCSFTGKLITLLRAIDFTAVGTISGDVISFRLTGNYGVYQLIGSLCHDLSDKKVTV